MSFYWEGKKTMELEQIEVPENAFKDIKRRDLEDMLRLTIPVAHAALQFLELEESGAGTPEWCEALYILKQVAEEAAQMGVKGGVN